MLTELVDRTLNKDPSKRPSMKEFEAELSRLMSRLLSLGISEETATRRLSPLEPDKVKSSPVEAQTITRDRPKAEQAPTRASRWPYLVGGSVALVWLVLLAGWALS